MTRRTALTAKTIVRMLTSGRRYGERRSQPNAGWGCCQNRTSCCISTSICQLRRDDAIVSRRATATKGRASRRIALSAQSIIDRDPYNARARSDRRKRLECRHLRCERDGSFPEIALQRSTRSSLRRTQCWTKTMGTSMAIHLHKALPARRGNHSCSGAGKNFSRFVPRQRTITASAKLAVISSARIPGSRIVVSSVPCTVRST